MNGTRIGSRAAAKFSTAKRPPAGISVDEAVLVRMLSGAPGDSVAIRCDYAEVCLSSALLEDLARAPTGSWTTETERLALIAAGRAKKLLAAAARQQPLLAPFSAEIAHLVVQLLENGLAYVRHAMDGSAIAELEIRYVGQRIGATAGFGRIVVCERDVGLPLLTADWWVA